MRDTSCVVSPIRDHAFFEETKLERLFGNDLLERGRLAAQVLDLVGGRGPRGVACQPALAGFEELLRPDIIQALGDALAAAQLGNAVLAAYLNWRPIAEDLRAAFSPKALSREFASVALRDELDRLCMQAIGARRSDGRRGDVPG
jgi:hypothetical protein